MEFTQYLHDPDFMSWTIRGVIAFAGLMMTAAVGILVLLGKIAWVLVPFLSQWKANFQVQIVECDGKFNLIHEKIQVHGKDIDGLKTRVAIIETRKQ